MKNELTMRVLLDGTVKLTNQGGFDADKHGAADAIVKELETAFGGKCEVERKPTSLNPQSTQSQSQHHKH